MPPLIAFSAIQRLPGLSVSVPGYLSLLSGCRDRREGVRKPTPPDPCDPFVTFHGSTGPVPAHVQTAHLCVTSEIGLAFVISSHPCPPFFCLCALEIGDSLRHQPNTISQTLSEPPEYTKVPGLSVIFFYFNILTQVLTQFPPPQIPNNPKLWVIN